MYPEWRILRVHRVPCSTVKDKDVFARSDAVPVITTVHVNGDGNFDGQNGFQTHLAHHHQHYINF